MPRNQPNRSWPVVLLVAGAVLACLAGCDRPTDGNIPYQQRRQSFRTSLRRRSGAPQNWQPFTPPPGWQEVRYPSGNQNFKAWLHVPRTGGRSVPAVVYFHGGFACSREDLDACEPFVRAGWVVFVPTVRGENGNPLPHEFLWGEASDAKAAIRWLTHQHPVDAGRIYAIGHSIGGALVDLLSLHDDVPLAMSASVGALYSHDDLRRFGRKLPFDPNRPGELHLRTLLGNIRWMRRPHVVYMGRADRPENLIAARAEDSPGRLTLLEIRGDHHSSLAAALENFRQRIRDDQ